MSDLELLKRRAAIVRQLRAFFDQRGFLEVETATAIAAPAPEEHIDCPRVVGSVPSPAAEGSPLYLRASPELQMKRLLALGLERLYQLGPCFREGERGSRHQPEFTMLEWYRRGATYRDIQRDLESLFGELAAACPEFPRPGAFAVWQVREAYRRHAGWDPWLDWNQDRFDFDMATKIEPALQAHGGGVFLTDYPPAASSLAIVAGGVAERWEFYYNGMELANCFSELCDSAEQRRRFERARANRRALGEADYPLDEEFLSAVGAIGQAAGVALGVDRLVMVLTGAKTISDVRVIF